MFKTTEEGLASYRAEFIAFVAWVQEVKRLTILKPEEKFSPMMHMGKEDWEKSRTWGAQLTGMEKALGLTKEEVEKIETEIGYRPQKAA